MINDVLVESTNEIAVKKTSGGIMFTAPMIQMNKRNRNNRIYPSALMQPIVDAYIRDMVKKNRAVGELHHPDPKDTGFINLERVSHKIVKLELRGDDYIGTAKVITGVPAGDVLQRLLEEGVVLGTSTRGMGSVDKNNIVTGYRLISAADIEFSPSAPDAFVSILTESDVLNNHRFDNLREMVRRNNINAAFSAALKILTMQEETDGRKVSRN